MTYFLIYFPFISLKILLKGGYKTKENFFIMKDDIFTSFKMVDINLFIQLINLHDRWLDKPDPHLAANSYRLKQLF